MDDWKHYAEAQYKYGVKWPELYVSVQRLYPDITNGTIRDYVRRTDTYKASHTTAKPTLVFSDPHIPFNHPGFLPFLLDTYKRFKCGPVMCLGDLVDNHAISRHQTETCAKSPYDELEMSIVEIAKYTKAFPKVKMVLGNHDLVAIRQAATLGLGERFLRPLNELLQLPKTWELADEFIIDNVLYEHGINCTGVTGAVNAALRERMSTCIGHTHSNGGVLYAANKRDIIFGAHCGCGIDVSAYAFAYGTHSKNRPILGCTVVYSSSKAEFVPMSSSFFRGT